ncbi:uncharacterized protein NEMAJ01_0115 [Nematocida major]|uniref:uncharacterized protein n=1 Tax=Nematocida major TaxID=1912982 RepID=UPI002008E04B|nr:uncharacterized protein NEMAJ01_0115 [Nematocida major]KAH9385219.1 hypothetical protein NEMAJ01_0115 [Nematocida major]
MQLLFFLELLFICFAHARLSLNQLEELENFRIPGPLGKVPDYINPNGPLNFLHGYLYIKNGHVHNKRFFSPEIDTCYSLSVNTSSEIYKNEHIYERSPLKDKAYKPISERVKNEELDSREYHKRLIKMFPSIDGIVSIESGSVDSFVRFLRTDSDPKKTCCILASLLLLTEGVPVDIRIEKTAIVLHRADGSFWLCVDTNVPVVLRNNKILVIDSPTQYVARETIRFFKRSAKERAPVESLDEYMEGEFLNTPWFLIQAYIYEYAESMQCAQDIILSAHEILVDIIRAFRQDAHVLERARTAYKVFEKLFVSGLRREKTNQMHLIRKIRSCMEIHCPFPFSEFNQLPTYTRIPEYFHSACKFAISYSNTFSNCTENALYILMCCLLYSPNTEEYTLEGLPNPTKSLKTFFSLCNPCPVETVNIQIHQAWNKVVSGLETPELRYVRENKNELCSGILNVLLVIAEITGKLPSEKDTILGFIKEIHKEDSPSEEFYLSVKEYVASFFKALFFNKQIEVECVNFRKSIKLCGITDIHGEIHLKYQLDSKHEVLSVRIGMKHSDSVFITRDIALTKYSAYGIRHIANMFKEQGNLLGFLSWQYADGILARNKVVSLEGNILKAVEKAARNATPKGVNSLLVLKKIESLDYKSMLVNYSACLAIESQHKLSYAQPLARFISNILGSEQLDTLQVQKKLFAILLYTDSYSFARSKISVPAPAYRYIMQCPTECLDLLSCILKTPCPHVLVLMLKKAIEEEESVLVFKVSPILYLSNMKSIFTALFNDNAVARENVLSNVLLGKSKGWDAVIPLLNMAWFAFACQYKKDNAELIECIYNSITRIPNSIPSNLKSLYSLQRTSVLSYMRDHQAALKASKMENQFNFSRPSVFWLGRSKHRKFDEIYRFFRT